MALSVLYWLADIDGVLCVANRQVDWSEPRYVVNYWPTKIRTRDLCASYEIDAAKLRESFRVTMTLQGSASCTPTDPGLCVAWRRHFYADLVNGAKTQSIKTEFAPVPKPRVGKKSKLEWDSGRWHIWPEKGSHRVVDVSGSK